MLLHCIQLGQNHYKHNFLLLNRRKFTGPYDYRFNRTMTSSRQPVAQKKHQMYGRRFPHEPSIVHPPPPMHSHSSHIPDIAQNVPMKFEPFDSYSNIESSIGQQSSSQPILKPSTSTNNSEIKFSYALDFPLRQIKTGNNASPTQDTISNHNHTYALLPHSTPTLNNNGANPRPQTRDKKVKKNEDEHISRDEKRARALQIPISV